MAELDKVALEALVRQVLLERLVADISYRNSVAYFGFGRYHLRGAETL